MERAIGLMLAVVIASLSFAWEARAELMPGEVATVLQFSADESPEGIAVDRVDGAIFIGIRRRDGDLLRNEILRLDAQGQRAPYSILPPTPVDATGAGESGVLGLATDLDGAVFAALVSPDANTRGVYKISRGGAQVERLAGSGSMLYPNALAFDSQRNLYVSDSLGGSIWRFNPHNVNQTGALWLQDELLAHLPQDPLGAPIGGANGIAYFPHILYVANTEKGLIAGIPINSDGSPGVPTLIAGGTPVGRLITVDGIAVDANGNIHAVMPAYEAASLLVPPVLQPAGGYAPLVQVKTSTGEIIPTVFDSTVDPKFDVPLSLAFGSTADNRTTVFITNGALPAAQGTPGPGPRLIQVGIGLPGYVPEPTSHGLVAGLLLAMFIMTRTNSLRARGTSRRATSRRRSCR